LSPGDAGKADVPAVVPEVFVRPDELLQGADVLVLGYPGAGGALFWTEAVARKGIIAWLSPTSPITERFLIDANVSPGNSGGPVFRLPGGMDRGGNLVLGGRVSFLGIVSKALPEYVPVIADDGKANLKLPGLYAPSLVGLTVVEPAHRVMELLEAAAKLAP
jgi:hypothetical protein